MKKEAVRCVTLLKSRRMFTARNLRLSRPIAGVGVLLAVACAGWVFFMSSPSAKADIVSGLIGHWMLDENSGTTTADSSGSGINGTLVQTGASPAWTSPGHDGSTSSLHFDGAGAQGAAANSVNLGNSATLDGLAQHTVSMWVKFDPGYVGAGGAWANLVGRNSSAAQWEYMVYVNNTGHVRAHIMQSNNVVKYFDSPAVMPTGQWIHIAQVADGSQLRLYINGTQVASVAYDGTAKSLPAANDYIGQDKRERTPLATIDDVRIYSRGLNAREIGCLANGCVTYKKDVNPKVTTITPGQTFTYTITAQNTGARPLTGLSFTDSLSDVADDATYQNDIAASLGTATYNTGTNKAQWSGNLAVGQTASITYSFTMNTPDTGNGVLKNGVVGTGVGANCTENPAVDPNCLAISPLPVLSSQKTLVSPASPKAGDTVQYQFVITNTGASGVSAANVADDLNGVLDDATYNNDAVATSGALSYNPTTRRLAWNGGLAAAGNAGDSVTVTYSVKINAATNLGDATLNNAIISSDCPNPAIFDSSNPGYEANCVTSTPVTAWSAIKTTTATNGIKPGATANYTITVTNTGAVNLTGGNAPALDDNLADVLDDAIFDNSTSQATSGTLTYTNPMLHWTGNLNSGQTATITYSAAVKPLGSLGNANLANAIGAGPMNCPVTPTTNSGDPSFSANCATLTSIDTTDPSVGSGTSAPTAGGSSGSGLANTGEDAWAYGSLAAALMLIGCGVAFYRKKIGGYGSHA